MTLIMASAVRSCLGDGAATFQALLSGRCGVAPLTHIDSHRVHVPYGYPIEEPGGNAEPRRAAPWLRACVAEVLRYAAPGPVPVIVGTGLGELRAVEEWAVGGDRPRLNELHFTAALRDISSAVGPVLTISNACSASGHALALAADLIEQGLAEQVVAAGCDSMTETMLAMIGRVSEEPTDRIRPFDVDRQGVLLGEGAAAVLLSADPARPGLAKVLGTGVGCDAYHETAPSADGIARTMAEALVRAGAVAGDVDVVISHGTGTVLNDAAESRALTDVLVGNGGDPLVTAIKGSIGHTSGASALMSLDVAVRCLRTGTIPPVAGLRAALPEASKLRLVSGEPASCVPRVVQVDSFGFGGVNTVTLIGAA